LATRDPIGNKEHGISDSSKNELEGDAQVDTSPERREAGGSEHPRAGQEVAYAQS